MYAREGGKASFKGISIYIYAAPKGVDCGPKPYA